MPIDARENEAPLIDARWLWLPIVVAFAAGIFQYMHNR